MNKKFMKLMFAAVVVVLVLSAFGPAITARADGEDYLNNPGRQQAVLVGAQCDSGAGSGAFGAFGKDNNMAGGADGVQTGLNNSALCGNRQGNLP